VTRFDLVVRLDRSAQSPAKLELGDLLLTRGITAAELMTLRNDGHVQLGRHLDFEAANALAHQLEVGGTVVELLELPPDRADAPDRDQVADEARSVEVTLNDFDVGVEAAAADPMPPVRDVPFAGAPPEPGPDRRPSLQPPPGLREIVMTFDGGQPLAIDPPPPPSPRALSVSVDPFVPLPETEEALAVERPAAPFAAPVAAPVPEQTVSAREAVAPVPAPPPPATESRCPRCHALLAGDESCAACAEVRRRELRKKLFGGALHDRAPLRFGIGFVAALALGYVGAAPYERHAAHQAEQLRERANELRYRPDPELRARAAALDEEADAVAGSAAVSFGVVWLVVSALLFAAWILLT
jgi:hypothetical protein